MTRPVLFLLLVITGLSLSSCKKKMREVTFEMPYQAYVWIPYTDKVNIPYPVPGTVATNYMEQFAGHGVTKEDVKSIRLKLMKYSIVEPLGANFNFLGNIKISVQVPNELEEEVASAYDINTGISALNLSIPDKDLTRFVTRDSLDMKAMVTLDEPMVEGVRIKSELMFEVKAEVVD